MSDPLIGKQLGDYVIQSLLGRGGMARVYKGYDERLQRYAAVKVINNDFSAADQAEYTERFRREARAIAHLHHPNIVGVYQFGDFEGNYYMAMVFLDGQDLRQILKDYAERGEYMPLPDVLNIVQGMGSALDYAHSRGVIHRDIKPSNIVIDADKRPILTDFGLALNMSEGTLGDTFGSAHYIAPEQAISSAKAVPQSDLYSLGVCLYEMLAGKVPFDDPSAMSVALKHLNDTPPPPHLFNPDLSPTIEQIVLKMLDKDPGQRYPNGAAFAQAFEAAIAVPRSHPVADQEAVLADTNRGAQPAKAAKADKDVVKAKRARPRKTPVTSEEDYTTTPLKPPISLEHAAPGVQDSKPPTIRQEVSAEPASAPISFAVGNDHGGKAEAHAALADNGPAPIQSRRRARWLAPLIGVILLLGLGGVFASGALNGGSTATPSASIPPASSTTNSRTQAAQTTQMAKTTQTAQTAVALAAVGTQSATGTARLTRTSTRTPTRTITSTATYTASPSRTATRTATLTASQTGTITATATISPSATPASSSPATSPVTTGDVATSASGTLDVSLVYDDNQMDVINVASYPVDISDLSFVQKGNTTVRYDVPKFWSSSPYSPTALPSSFCYQIYPIDHPQPAILRDCRVAAWVRVADSRQVWKAQDSSVSSFNVLLGERVIATCSIKAGHCEFSLS